LTLAAVVPLFHCSALKKSSHLQLPLPLIQPQHSVRVPLPEQGQVHLALSFFVLIEQHYWELLKS